MMTLRINFRALSAWPERKAVCIDSYEREGSEMVLNISLNIEHVRQTQIVAKSV